LFPLLHLSLLYFPGGSLFEINLSVGSTAGTFYYNITYANDTAGNLGVNTSILSVTVNAAADAFPQWQDNSTNSTTAGTVIEHRVNWTDDTALAGYIFSFDNGTGTFSNDSFVEMSGTQNWSNVSKVVNATVGATIQWRVYANDSLNQLNATDIFVYNATAGPSIEFDLIYPTGNLNVTQNEFFNISVNVTCRNENCGEINVSLDPFQFAIKSLEEDIEENTEGENREFISNTHEEVKELTGA